ncbi:MAG: transcriptional regulator [Firmicutes bacterium HGW-Firmicutes-1]|jgi:putative transcriptional regulator|nr:MAG: transcriptional regulator [Firmicutes bacterium HGW-Firmicutes-1]
MRNKLKEARLDKQLTHNEMADQIGLVRSSYTNIEVGVKNPSERVVLKIREILDNYDEDLFE